MGNLTFRAPAPGDVEYLAAHMRMADRVELAAINRVPAEALERAVRTSTLCWTVLAGDELLCMFGVAPLRSWSLLEDTGSPWFLGTEGVFAHRRPFISEPAAYIRRMLDAYPRLVNFVHAENQHSVRWLRRLGFTVEPAQPWGPNGAPFHRFEMTRDV